jgi:hypothetical protein
VSLVLSRTHTIEVRGDIACLRAQLTDCCLKVNLDLTNLGQELVKLKESNKVEHFEG